MYCRKCGAQIDNTKKRPDGTVRCPGCGKVYRLNPRSENGSYTKQNSSVQKHTLKQTYSPKGHRKNGSKQNRKTVFSRRKYVYLAVVLFIICTIILCGWKHESILNLFTRYATIMPQHDYSTFSDNDRVLITADNASIYSDFVNKNLAVSTTERGNSFPFLKRIQQEENGQIWFKVRIDNENSGWISSEQAKLVTCDSSEPLAYFSLLEFGVADEEMKYLFADTKTSILFTVKTNSEFVSPIYLINPLTNEVLGEMRDDGRMGDIEAGDGIFSIQYKLKASSYGIVMFAAMCGNETSNYEVIRFFNNPTEEEFAASESLLESVNKVDLIYRENGFVKPEYYDSAIDAVGEYVESLYDEGAICDYLIEQDYIMFQESKTGVRYTYTPAIKDTLASGESLEIIIALPYANSEKGKLELSSSYTYLANYAYEEFGYRITEYKDSQVTPETLIRIMKPNQFFIWNGHGIYSYLFGPELITGQDCSFDYLKSHALDFLSGRIGVEDDDRIYVTAKYIEKYGPDISGSLIWLSACSSGKDYRLAYSFIDKGAATVVGFTGITYESYVLGVFRNAIYYMTQINEQTGEYYTVSEAVESARQNIGNDDVEYLRALNNEVPSGRRGSSPVIYGNWHYQLKRVDRPKQTPIPAMFTINPPELPMTTLIPDSAYNGQLSASAQYSANMLMSIYVESGLTFFDSNNIDIGQLAHFAYVHCGLNHTDDRVGIKEPWTGTVEIDGTTYYTEPFNCPSVQYGYLKRDVGDMYCEFDLLPLGHVNEILDKYIGVSIAPPDGSQYYAFWASDIPTEFLNNAFVIPNFIDMRTERCAIVDNMTPVNGGCFQFEFTIYGADTTLDNVIPEIRYESYFMTPEQAAKSSDLYAVGRGVAIVQPKVEEGQNKYTLISLSTQVTGYD